MLSPSFYRIYRLLLKSKPRRSDAIIWLQGDRYDRAHKTLELFKLNYASRVVITGNNVLLGNRRKGENNISILTMHKWLVLKKVSPKKVISDIKSFNAWEQAMFAVSLAKHMKWKSLLVVASGYHQPRVFLTFLRAAHTVGWNGTVINQPVNQPLGHIPSGRSSTCKDLMMLESDKIQRYRQNVATYSEGFRYLKNQ